MKLFSVIVVGVSFAAISSADLKSEINSMNSKIHLAMKKGDMKTCSAIMKAGVTKDFKYIEGGKTMTFDQMMEQMKASMSMMKLTKVSTSIVSLKEKGGMGTSVEKHVMEGTMTGPDKKSHTMSFSGNSTNTYRKVGKAWMLSVMSWGKNTMMMDGKPMDMSKMGG
ncbi:MAG: nuclear transport factor 2 family protein [Armatimonadota bacterium]